MVSVPVLILLLSAFTRPGYSVSAPYLIPGEMNHTEAQAACRRNYSNLVTVYSKEDNTELVNMMKEHVGVGWIGLHYGKWSNGDPVTYRALTGICETLSCAAMKADGNWESIQCTENRSFMCYKQDVHSQTLDYYLVQDNKNWPEAQSYCRKHHTDLVSINDQQQNEKVMKERKNITNSIWIGLLCDGWNWADGGNSTYRNWSSEPQKDKCVVLNKAGGWEQTSCSDKHSALCYTSSIHVSDEVMIWEKALDYCQTGNRSELLTITNETIQEEVKNELSRRRVSDPVWVGLRRSQLFGFWLWTNKRAVYPYSNWDEEKAPEDLLAQNCGAVSPQKQFKWTELNCQSKYRAVCHMCV